MKIMKYLTMGLLFIGITTLMGCKKEDVISKNLWNKGGVWNIEKYQNNWNYGSGSDSYILYDAGTYQFNKDGSGKLILQEDGESYSNLFTYENTETSLKLTFKLGEMYYEGDVEKYTLDWEKNKVSLYSYTSHQYGYDEYKIDLKKK